MSVAKHSRSRKQQLGQFMTPDYLAERIVSSLAISGNDKVLEPSSGDGAFLLPLIEKFISLQRGSPSSRYKKVMLNNIYATELDEELYGACLARIENKYGPLPKGHHLVCGDFFETEFEANFDYVVGNPPFGGTLFSHYANRLESLYGRRAGQKIKKETYSFFVVRCLDLLSKGGKLSFICSDTFLTINTMKGLRLWLMEQGTVSVNSLATFSEETDYPMVVLDYLNGAISKIVTINEQELAIEDVMRTENASWGIDQDLLPYFSGRTLASVIVASSGMTIGKNALFLRRLSEDGSFLEPYKFSITDEPITLAGELSRAQHHHLSSTQQEKVLEQVSHGATRKVVRAVERKAPKRLSFPHKDYLPYNKAQGSILYSSPDCVVYWKNQGEAVLTYKKSGNWYLRGVGGQPFFLRSGLTWQLIASRINMRYLPAGYILDSGAPCAFLRPGVDEDELWFVLGWCLTEACTKILKQVINHTMNIQGKDVERLPYPYWVSRKDKERIIVQVQGLVKEAQAGNEIFWDDEACRKLDELFAL
jgi:hypothetical protein